MAGNAPRQRRRLRQPWQCGFCNLQNLKEAEEFEENHIGYNIDMDQLYQDYLKFKARPPEASEARRSSYADAEV